MRADAALLLDWESWWALELDAHPSSRLRLMELLREFYRPLFEAGVTTDFAHPESDLSGYRLVLVPALYLVSDAGAENVRRFVERGGTALISFFSGIVDPADRVRLGGYPAPWRDLLGLRVEEFAPLPDGRDVPPRRAARTRPRRARGGGRGRRSGRTSSTCAARLPLLSFSEGHLAGEAAATGTPTARARPSTSARCRTGRPCAAWSARACRRAGLEFRTGLPRGVEAVRRGDYLFVISHLDPQSRSTSAPGASTC